MWTDFNNSFTVAFLELRKNLLHNLSPRLKSVATLLCNNQLFNCITVQQSHHFLSQNARIEILKSVAICQSYHKNTCFMAHSVCDSLTGFKLQLKDHYTATTRLYVQRNLSRDYKCDSTAIRLRQDYDEKLTCSFFARVE